MWIDTHCHLTGPELRAQLDGVLTRARQAGVRRMVLVATNPSDARAGLELVHTHPELDLVAGIHPHEAARADDDLFVPLEALLRGEGHAAGLKDRIVGVGETGLDFHYDFAPRLQQELVFRRHLELAIALDKPVVIHARESEGVVCDILADYTALAQRVVFHCFSADKSIARRVLDLGHYLSFTGVVTFKNAEQIRESAAYVPGERIMVETDAPYLTPEPKRKVRPNEPAYVVLTGEYLATLRGLTAAQFAAQTTDNARRFFKLRELSE